MAVAKRQDSASSDLSRCSESEQSTALSTPETSRPPSLYSSKPVSAHGDPEEEEGSRDLQSYLDENAGYADGEKEKRASMGRDREFNMKTPTPETYRKKRNALGMTMSAPADSGKTATASSSTISSPKGTGSDSQTQVATAVEDVCERPWQNEVDRWKGQGDACGLNSKLETLLRASALMQDEETTSESNDESEIDADADRAYRPSQETGHRRLGEDLYHDKTPSAAPKHEYLASLSPRSELPAESSFESKKSKDEGAEAGASNVSSPGPWRKHMDYFFRLHQARADDAAAKGNLDQYEQERFLANKELKRLRRSARREADGKEAKGTEQRGKRTKAKGRERLPWGRSRSYQSSKNDGDSSGDEGRVGRKDARGDDHHGLKIDGTALQKMQSHSADDDHLSVIERVASRAESTKSGRSSSPPPISTEGEEQSEEGRSQDGEGKTADDNDDDGEEHILMKGDEDDEEIQSTAARQRASSIGSKASSTGSQRDENSRKNLSDEEKLKILVSEFGESPLGEWNGNEEEKFIRDSPAVLFRRVLIKGYAALTSHRLTFLAFMSTAPSDNAGIPANQASGANLDGVDPASLVIRRGPAIVHRPGLTKRKRKVWFELTPEALTAYPSSNELYQPLASVRNVEIDVIQPYHEKPTCVQIKVKGKKGALLEFETVEAALSWQREIDAAVWHAHYGSDKVRVSLPLARILDVETTTIMNFATNLTFTVLDTPQPSAYSTKDLYPHTHKLRDKVRWHDIKNDPTITTRKIDFSITEEWLQNMFADFTMALKVGKEWRATHATQDWPLVPYPTIEIEGGRRRREDGKDDGDGESDVEEVMNDKGEVAEDQHEKVRKRIIREFSLECRPDEVSVLKADIVRSIPSGGILAIGPKYLCFYRRRTMTGMSDVRVKLPLADIQDVRLSKAYRWHYHGLRVQIRAHEDILFEVRSEEQRDKAVAWILDAVKGRKARQNSTFEERQQKTREESPARRLAQHSSLEVPSIPKEAINLLPKIVNAAPGMVHRVSPMKIICLTIGSRGDVQPYLALCKGLQKQGHECIIVSHAEYEDWVAKYGIAFRPAGGDPSVLMKLNVETKLFSAQFFRESIGKFRHWLDELLRAIAEQCYDADLIIESPSTFGGIHVAEAIGCSYMRAFTMPWTRTTSYPQAFSVPSTDLGGQYNAMSYTLFDQILWRASAGQINRWRKHMLNLPSTNLDKLDQSSIPFMYNFSPAVVPPPLDWGDRIEITGYWFLSSEAEKWQPPEELTAFLENAKSDDKKIAYIGFGSITIPDPTATTKAIYEAVKKADVRAIVSKGWSARGSTKKQGQEEKEPEVPEECYVVDSIPHDWLFPRIDIALHHGGAGTTGASLRAGLVTLIHPFFGDQFFWSGRVDKLGAGLKVNTLDVDDLAASLAKAAKDRVMVEKAQRIGEAIRSERGVDNAIKFINTNLVLSKRKRPAMSQKDLQRHRRRSSVATSMSESGASDSQSQGGRRSSFTTSSASTSEAETDDDDEEGLDEGGEPTIRNTQTNTKDRSSWSFNGLLKSDSWKAAAIYPFGAASRTSGSVVSKSTSIPNKIKSHSPGLGGQSDAEEEGESGQRVASPQPLSRSASMASQSSSSSSSPLKKDSWPLSGTNSPRLAPDSPTIAPEGTTGERRVSGGGEVDGSSSPMRRGSSMLQMHKNLHLMPSMPHFSMPHLPNVMRSASIAGLSGSSSNAKEGERDRKESRDGGSEPTEDERAAQARTHKTAKIEDERRKGLLVDKWKATDRWDLVKLWDPDTVELDEEGAAAAIAAANCQPSSASEDEGEGGRDLLKKREKLRELQSESATHL